MRCMDVMTKNPVCCLPVDSAVTAARIMKEEDVGPVPVIDDPQSRRVVGLVTDRDLAIKVVADGRNPATCKVEDIMTEYVVTCHADDDLECALKAMKEHQVRRIIVVDGEDRLAGIIAQADVATRGYESTKTAEVVEEISRPNIVFA
jgi:CBS domain-containing protein